MPLANNENQLQYRDHDKKNVSENRMFHRISDNDSDGKSGGTRMCWETCRST